MKNPSSENQETDPTYFVYEQNRRLIDRLGQAGEYAFGDQMVWRATETTAVDPEDLKNLSRRWQ